MQKPILFFLFKKQSYLRSFKVINKLLLTIPTLLLATAGFSQINLDSTNILSNKEINGVLLDLHNKTPLPYANIIILSNKKGTITNEKGQFLLNTEKLNKNDSISFQYIGYETKNLAIKQLDSSSAVYLKEDNYSLDEIFVFSNNIDPESIVKKVLENRDSNYRTTLSKKQIFIRNRSVSDIEHFDIDFKKSSFDELNEEKVRAIEQKIPKHSVSFTDFLGDMYFSNSTIDSLQLKIDPIKMVSLKDKNLADMEQLETTFEKLLTNVKEKEYWKIKSGIIGGKVQISNDLDKEKRDSLKAIGERRFKTRNFRNSTNYYFKYSLFKDKKDWDFLYNTNRYDFSLVGGTVVNDEDVYIIDFVPKSKGKFKGRIFIALKTFALIRADYEYAEGKTGTNIHLFGVGYSMNGFQGSISFKKNSDNYQLSYCSRKESSQVSFDRNLALIKKSKRFLMDKKLKEIKVRFDLSVSEENSFEVFVLDQEDISQNQFNAFQQKEFISMIYVNQFDDTLWEGYSIIEPTKQMREYKKMEQ